MAQFLLITPSVSFCYQYHTILRKNVHDAVFDELDEIYQNSPRVSPRQSREAAVKGHKASDLEEVAVSNDMATADHRNRVFH